MQRESILIFADARDHILYKTISIENRSIGVYSCQEASRFSKECGADIVVIDCGFNDDKGLDLLREIKASNANTLVIFVTDSGSEETAVNVFRSGAREYFKKPVDILKLKSTVEALLKIKQTSKERRLRFNAEQVDEFSYIGNLVTTDKPPYLLKVIQFIRENMAQEIRLDDCANEASLSKYHFCRNFKKYIGMRPVEFITFMRVNKAKDLLGGDNLNITEVASYVGFNNPSHFSATFRKLTGSTPKEFRNSLRRSHQSLPDPSLP